MIILTGVGPLTSAVPPNIGTRLIVTRPLAEGVVGGDAPVTLLGTKPLSSTTVAGAAPVLYRTGLFAQSNRSYATYPFTFKVYPAPELRSLDLLPDGFADPVRAPVTLTAMSVQGSFGDPVRAPVTLTAMSVQGSFGDPVRAPVTLTNVGVAGDALIYVPRRDYLLEFEVEPARIRIYHNFFFDILKVAATADITYDIVTVPKTRYTYDAWTYNILLTDKPYVSYGFSFSVANPRIRADFYFDVGEPITHYDFSFNVASVVRSTFDFEWDVIETWVPVTLPCTAYPVRPGVVPPSAKKHRLNIRVYAGAILVGAGYATYVWAGPDDAQIIFTIADIPQLSAEHRIVIYDDTKKVYDRTLPYSEFWGDSYGNT